MNESMILIVGSGRWGNLFSKHLSVNHDLIVTKTEMDQLEISRSRKRVYQASLRTYLNDVLRIIDSGQYKKVILVLPPDVRSKIIARLDMEIIKYIEKPAATNQKQLSELIGRNVFVFLKYRSVPFFKTLLEMNECPTSTSLTLMRPPFRPGVRGWRSHVDPLLEEGIHFFDFLEQLHKSRIHTIERQILGNLQKHKLKFENGTTANFSFLFHNDDYTLKLFETNRTKGLWVYKSNKKIEKIVRDASFIKIAEKQHSIFDECLMNPIPVETITRLHLKLMKLL